MADKIPYVSPGNLEKAVDKLKSLISGRQGALTDAQLAAIDSGITATKVSRIDTLTDSYIKGLIEDFDGNSY